jgi:hypothetical protein
MSRKNIYFRADLRPGQLQFYGSRRTPYIIFGVWAETNAEIIDWKVRVAFLWSLQSHVAFVCKKYSLNNIDSFLISFETRSWKEMENKTYDCKDQNILVSRLKAQGFLNNRQVQHIVVPGFSAVVKYIMEKNTVGIYRKNPTELARIGYIGYRFSNDVSDFNMMNIFMGKNEEEIFKIKNINRYEFSRATLELLFSTDVADFIHL